MEKFLGIVEKLCRYLNVLGIICITSLLLLTVTDVISRCFGSPVEGSYELVSFLGAMVIGFSVPLTSWIKGHVFVDSFILILPRRARSTVNIITRCLGIFLFIFIGLNLVLYGIDLHKTNEVSQTLRIPFYPVAYGLGICCFIQCVVLFCDIARTLGGGHE